MKKLENISIPDKDIRWENMVWTIAKNYDFKPELGLLHQTPIEALNKLRVSVLGYLYAQKESKHILNYFRTKKTKTGDAAIVTELIILALGEALLDSMYGVYGGIVFMEQKATQETLIYYDKRRKRGDVSHEIRYAYYANKVSVPKTNKRVMDLLEDLIEFRTLDLTDFPKNMDALLQKHFHFEEDQEELSQSKKEDSLKNDKKEKTQTQTASEKIEETEQVEVMAAEFSQVDIGVTEKKHEKDMADKSKDVGFSADQYAYRRIIENYGEPSFDMKKIQKLQRDLSVGIHQDEKIHITQNFDKIKGYKKTKLDNTTVENLEHFQYSGRVYQRNITKLRDRLFQSLSQDMDFSPTNMDNGLITPNRIWRREVLGDPMVFHKNYRDARGEMVVEILLDGSGSQMERQSQVAAQGYVIAEALTQVGIPCRVSSFNNLFDYSILRIYRDYKDMPAKNRRIMSYSAEGSNRDGLAIGIVGSLLLEQEEEHKILIILSDGKPNDERTAGKFDVAGSKTRPYTGTLAIDDTAKQVRNLRAKGIAVLGVFTGKDEDLEAEQRIFGRDFAYISQIERFSEIVGMYLKKQIQYMLDA